jgi:hypothetical protein
MTDRKEYWKKRYKESKPENPHRKATSANGYLDALAIRAEEASSYLSRRNNPAHQTLLRITDLAEKAQNYTRTTEWEKRSPNFDNQKKKVIDRIWKAYQVVQEKSILHESSKFADESNNNAKQDVNGRWVSEPVTYYGDALEDVLANEQHGNKAKGITKLPSIDDYDDPNYKKGGN